MSLIMSPSMYKEWKSCPRKGLISSNRFLGNIHTVYGRAYEHGAKYIIDNLTEFKNERGWYWHEAQAYTYPESEEVVRKLIVGHAILQGARYLRQFDKPQHKEKNVFTLAIGLANTYHWFNSFLDKNVVEGYEERIIFEGANFVIGGAFDFMAKSNRLNASSIYDFKGITSLWNYSFPSSPQIPIYTVLKQMALLASGSDKAMSMNGGYAINMTSAKKEEDPFLYIPVNTKLVLANLDNMMDDFIRCGKELHKLQQDSPAIVMQYMNAPVNMDTCTANFNCFHLGECSNSNFSMHTNPDDRVFDKLTKYTFSASLLKEAIKKIRANSSVVNLVDGDGIGSGDMFDEGVVEDFFGDDSGELILGEL